MTALDPNSPVLSDIETPALLVDGTLLAANIERMAAATRRAGVALRPHAKTHKSPDIARQQLEAGALGIACATLREAEDMIAAGVQDVLITSPVVGTEKVRRLVELHRSSPLSAVIDHPSQVDDFSAALDANDTPLALLVDVDVGQARTGVTSAAECLALARHIAAKPPLRFVGLQGYAGHVQHIIAAQERAQAARETAAVLRTCSERLRRDGLAPAVISGGGTGSSGFDLDGGCFRMRCSCWRRSSRQIEADRSPWMPGPRRLPSTGPPPISLSASPQAAATSLPAMSTEPSCLQPRPRARRLAAAC